jgi:hypothetical protein
MIAVDNRSSPTNGRRLRNVPYVRHAGGGTRDFSERRNERGVVNECGRPSRGCSRPCPKRTIMNLPYVRRHHVAGMMNPWRNGSNSAPSPARMSASETLMGVVPQPWGMRYGNLPYVRHLRTRPGLARGPDHSIGYEALYHHPVNDRVLGIDFERKTSLRLIISNFLLASNSICSINTLR